MCNLYDDNGIKKELYHCDGCKMCRVGPAEKIFHCNGCNVCYNIIAKNNHKCVLNIYK